MSPNSTVLVPTTSLLQPSFTKLLSYGLSLAWLYSLPLTLMVTSNYLHKAAKAKTQIAPLPRAASV